MARRNISLTEISAAVQSMRSAIGERYARIWLAAVATIVLAVSVAGADEVELVGGDVLRGTVVEQTDTHVLLEHSALGRLQIARDQITSLVVDTPPAEEGAGAEPLEKADKKKDKKWTSHLSLTFNGASGNTEENSFRIGGRSRRETPATRLRLDAAYYVSTSAGVVDNNKFTSGIVHDWLRPESPWFLFTSARYDYDQFESWGQRINAKGGPGYHLIAKDNFDLALRVGIGPKKEFGSQNNDWFAEGLVGVDLNWKMPNRQSFDVSSAIFPIVDDPEDFRTRTTVNWAIKVADGSDLSLSAGLT
ncbi:MAG: DUF481 domain-containing protein, partial [Thermoanaerobaculia bacterium]